MSNELVKDQFNRQAANFSNWSVTRNAQYMQVYADFCRLGVDDALLDVACGTGEFSIFCAPRVKEVMGVDIAAKEIGLAKKQARDSGLTNARFIRHDVEAIPRADRSHSIVTCKSALHHMPHCDRVFGEMVRCCRNTGRISVQDIVAYDEPGVNDFFERLEKAIDRSHHATLTKERIKALYEDNDLTLVNELPVAIELNVQEYLGHARQSQKDRMNIEALLEDGLKDASIASYFKTMDGGLYFKRNVLLVLGTKNRG